MEILTRIYYADKVDSWIGKGNIIVLVGPRRVGKSYLLKDFIERHSKEEDINVIYVMILTITLRTFFSLASITVFLSMKSSR